MDVYWAAFSNMIKPLAPEPRPMPRMIREMFTATEPSIVAATKPILIEHRDFIITSTLPSPSRSSSASNGGARALRMRHREAAGRLGGTGHREPVNPRHFAVEGHAMLGERPLNPFATRGGNVRQYQMLVGRDAHPDSLELRDDPADSAPISNRNLVTHSSVGNQDSGVEEKSPAPASRCHPR